MSIDTLSSSTEPAVQNDITSDITGMPAENELAQPSAQTWGTSSSLLASLWSPLTSLFGTYTPSRGTSSNGTPQQSAVQDQVDDRAISNQSDNNNPREEEEEEENRSKQPQNQTQESSSPSQPDSKSNPVNPPNPEKTPESNPHPQPVPLPYYTPTTTPTYKRLQKLRPSGTRTKQLIRAASRARDDPPPPPELGACCGSSCDPCVNDLWREERDVWRERWGDYAVEGVGGRGRSLEW